VETRASTSNSSAGFKFKTEETILGGVMVIMLAIGPKVHGFKPSQELLIFKGDKNP
jgi:hypothetical protein